MTFSEASAETTNTALAEEAGEPRAYTQTSVKNWTERGMIPREPVPRFIAMALAERLGRPVDPAEIGMPASRKNTGDAGLDFHRDTHTAVHNAAQFWSTVHRRTVLNAAFALGANSAPLTRWLAVPADPDASHTGTRRVGRQDLDSLWAAAAHAQRQDSRFGGGTREASQVDRILREHAIPLLHGGYTDAVGRELYAGTAELARVAGWSALDMGRHSLAQRHFIQALRMAKAAGSMNVGCHVLTNLALQTTLRGYPDAAVDMAQGAYDRARHQAAPRVLAFARLIEARAHARLGDRRAAAAALTDSERLLQRADTAPGNEPSWISYYTPARMSADAVEIHRDLKLPDAALRWNERATMSATDFTRSVGMRMTLVASAHLQRGDLDRALADGHGAVVILSSVRSARATDYLTSVVRDMAPWRRNPQVADFAHRAHQAIAGTATRVT
ncbi:sporulation protein [Streptomyces sp. NPDC051014]|uniref:sporulation protein n=1 Tax=Streptomyces sp. NPDC051014 TaxID=3155751 RepID=UPI00340411D8